MNEKLVSKSLTNRDGSLYINEWSAREIADLYGTPLYVMRRSLLQGRSGR